jgi:uncharacterized protein YndB with AHSA1/START domain
MNERATEHATFVIERTFDATPAQVFAAWADPVAKARWFVGPGGWQELRRELDFRVGGSEHVSGSLPDMVTRFDSYYHEIVHDERIIYSYRMHLNETPISVSLATVEFKPAEAGTRLVVTEQSAFLDDYKDGGGREHGTGILMDQLEAVLGHQLAAV